jgi:hypothetical protein
MAVGTNDIALGCFFEDRGFGSAPGCGNGELFLVGIPMIKLHDIWRQPPTAIRTRSVAEGEDEVAPKD